MQIKQNIIVKMINTGDILYRLWETTMDLEVFEIDRIENSTIYANPITSHTFNTIAVFYLNERNILYLDSILIYYYGSHISTNEELIINRLKLYYNETDN